MIVKMGTVAMELTDMNVNRVLKERMEYVNPVKKPNTEKNL